MDKYVFLNIDGVLNNTTYYKEMFESGKLNGNYPYDEFNPEKIELLNTLIENTGAKVVVSSTWRTSHPKEELQEIMSVQGFKYEVFDYTPRLSFGKGRGTVPRGCEIKAWLDDNCENDCEQKNVQYVILDDDSDMLLWQRENYFQVDPYCGLTPNIVYRIERFFNKC